MTRAGTQPRVATRGTARERLVKTHPSRALDPNDPMRLDSSPQETRILLMSADATAREWLSRVLVGIPRLAIQAVPDLSALDRSGTPPALILLDDGLSDPDALSCCRTLKADPAWLEVPVIYCMQAADPVDAERAVQAGATEILSKSDRAAVWGARLRTLLALRTAKWQQGLLEQALLHARHELDRLVRIDKPTGVWNRRHLEEVVLGEIERLRRYDHPLSLMILDIDCLKLINDRHGHGVGDQVLARLASLVMSRIRNLDSLARWGGGEFIVLAPNATLLAATMMAERLREVIAQSDFTPVERLTVSIGVAECMPGESWEHWLKRADAALHRAKAGGRDQVQIAPEKPRRAGLGEHVAANFVQLYWRESYACGHPVIDTQHRGLFDDTNRLLSAMLAAQPLAEVARLVETLIGDVIRHFNDEEAIFTAAGFPGADHHRAIHRALLERAHDLVARFRAGSLAIGELFQFLAHDMVAHHMLRSDREFFEYLLPRGDVQPGDAENKT